MLRRNLASVCVGVIGGGGNHLLSSSTSLISARRGVFADKARAGMIFLIDKRFYRVVGNTRSQKGQNAASFNIKLVEVGTGRKKEVTAGQGHDFAQVRAERVRLLFSGFDDDDMACFVYPEHTADAGKEVNIPGDSLPELQQKFLSCAMPVDVLHIVPDEDDVPNAKDIWAEVVMPSSYTYTVEKISLKGMYKMASFKECDGLVSVNESVQVNDKVKVMMKPDGTAAFGGRVS
ncbi:putative trans-sialidase [Trypanosoma rangeli]|uniref:Putative trans-sialidase n=1 Tax=Trypanosoma rangeli TaxID=5698 RepID=A0A3R7KDV7_TRYRA|nr:putative trans-sialidase [Trypanosoma rangeli]RNF04568.1 putative trans-sialidase [Trypanosoma rangeli]|eukprot:RNF04568.1 putative trans-sialidase [Trypanosoma rangeli]